MAEIKIESDGGTAVVSIQGEMTPDQQTSFDDFMAEWQDEVIKVIQDLAKDLGISDGAAQDIFYLRTRSRWTQEKENYLVWLDQGNKPFPNMMEDFEVSDEFRNR